jgi:hypothetical protein
MATGNPPLANVAVSLAGGPSAPRSDVTDSLGSVIFPALTVNPNTSNFYDVSASLSGYSTFPADLPYAGTGSPATSPEQVNHLTGNDDFNTIYMYKNGAAVTVNVYKSDGVTPFPGSSTVYMGATSGGAMPPGYVPGVAGNTATAAPSATITQLQLGNSHVTPAANTISIFPGSYEFSAESGTASSMTYATPQTPVSVPNNYPTDLTKTVNLVMGASPCTSNTTLTVTVKRSGSAVQNAHVEVYPSNTPRNTGVPSAPNVLVWGNTAGSPTTGQVTLIVPRNPTTGGYSYTIQATDARGSTGTTTQALTTATSSATVNIAP